MKACFKQRPIAARAETALHRRAQATLPEDTGFVAEPHGGSQPPVTRYRGPDAFFGLHIHQDMQLVHRHPCKQNTIHIKQLKLNHNNKNPSQLVLTASIPSPGAPITALHGFKEEVFQC